MHPGSQQDQRLPAALTPGYARPDEQRVADRLVRVQALARQLRFVDAQGRAAGRWSDALERDGAMLMAELATLPVAAWQARLRDDGPWHDATLRAQCLGLARRVDRWYGALREQAEARPHDDRLFRPVAAWLGEAVREQLGPRLRPLLSDASGSPAAAAVRGGPPDPLAAWHADWRGGRSGDAAPAALPARDDRLFWLALCRVLLRLRELAAQRFEAALAGGHHDPSMGLLLAWTQLLHVSRAPLNAFDERLVDHYYAERLALPRHPAGPQRVWLVLDAAPLLAEPVPLDPGQRFVAALPRGSRSFVIEQPPALQPLRVARLLSLRQMRDPLISPQREYGYASSIAAADLVPPTPESAAESRAPAWPALGGGVASQPARLGLAIASPLLLLREGTRRLQLTLEIAGPALPTPVSEDHGKAAFLAAGAFERVAHAASGQPEPGPREREDRLWCRVTRLCPPLGRQPWLAYLWARCLASADPDALARRLGRLLAVWLCGTAEDLEPGALALLRRHARHVFDRAGLRPPAVDVDDPLAMLYNDQPLERSLIFNRVFHDAWRVRASGDAGWLELGAALVAWPSDGIRGLQLRLQIGADLPALGIARPAIHGPGWPAQPVLQLLLDGRSRLFPASLLQQLALAAVRVVVDVQGLRSVQIYNQLGQLDPSKPFLPFGPLPDTSAYLQFSHVELMRKPLTRLRARLRYASLPALGLAEQYDGYPDGPWTPDVFRVRAELLRDGRWQNADLPSMALFPATVDGRPDEEQTLDLSSPAWLRLHAPQPEATGADYSLRSRQGFFRLRLDGPSAGFGHALYPRVLGERLTANSRRKTPLPPPLAPYTPVLASLRVDYTAQERVLPRPGATELGMAGLVAGSGPGGGESASSQLFHLTPFGVLPLRHLPGRHAVTVLPAEPAEGQLLIGLSGQAPSGTLSLLFLLRAESAAESLGRPGPALRWQAWCDGDWRTLEPHRVLLDATDGLLRSGLVLLDLPAGMSADCPALPPGLFWLRLLGDGQGPADLDLLAAIKGVWANGVAVRLEGPPRDEVLPPGSIRAAQTPVPGLAGIRQPWPSLPQRLAEDRGAWKQRVAERLRHRDRAVTPGDIERLVLETFPGVFKVKCLPRSSRRSDRGMGRDGDGRDDRIVVVVVPALPPGHDVDGTEAPRLDAATLLRVRRFLLPRMAPGYALLVRNATYDRIQVRGTLRLAAGEPAGRRLRELNQALRDFLSPWRPGGLTARFDWRLRAEEVEAYLRAQPGVEAVGGVSLLQVTRDDGGLFRFGDSARGDRVLRPRAPWSLALPTRGHLLELTDDPGERPAVSGLAQLSVGGSFIIGRAVA
jgi:hypothetical protein